MKSIAKILIVLFLVTLLKPQFNGKISLESGFYNSILNEKNENGFAGRLYANLQNKYRNDNFINNTNLIITPFILFNSEYKNVKSRLTNNMVFYNTQSLLGFLSAIQYNYYDNITDVKYLNYNLQPYYTFSSENFNYELQAAFNQIMFLSDTTISINKILIAPALTYIHSREINFSANFNYEFFNVTSDKIKNIEHSKGNIISAGATFNYITKLYLQLSYRFIQYNFEDTNLKNYEHYFRIVCGTDIYKDLSLYFLLDMSYPIQNVKSKNPNIFNPVLYSFNREQIINLKLSQLIKKDFSVYLKTGYEKDNIHNDVKYSGWNLFLGTELNF